MIRAAGFVIALLLLVPIPRSRAENPALKIHDIEVRLFYHHSGTFSEDISAAREHPFILWNTLIGAGDAEEPSTAVLATVIVEGPAGSFEPDRILEFETLEASGKRFYSSSSRLGVFSSSGLHHSGFWLAEVTCKDLRLKARIRGAPGETVESVTFHCGE